MLAAIVSKFLAWLGGRGLRILVREVADALEEAEVARDYRIAVQEKATLEAAAQERAGEDATRERIDNADAAMGDNPSLDAMRELLRARRNR